MGARATYPIREGFFLDTNTAVTGPYSGGPEPDAPINLGRIRTIRIIVLGATDVAGSDTVTVYLKRKSDGNGEIVTFYAEDFDDNGVGIAHVRGGKLENEDGYTAYYEVDGCTVDGVYLDAVENIA